MFVNKNNIQHNTHRHLFARVYKTLLFPVLNFREDLFNIYCPQHRFEYLYTVWWKARLELPGRLGVQPQFMSTDAHFWVKIGFKFQSMCKNSNISTSDPSPPSSFRSILALWKPYGIIVRRSVFVAIFPQLAYFRTDFTDLNLYCIKGALALVVLVSFSGYVC